MEEAFPPCSFVNVATRPRIKVEKSEKKVTKPEGDVFEFAGLTALGRRQSAPSAVMLSSYPKPVFNASSIRCRAAERTHTEREMNVFGEESQV